MRTPRVTSAVAVVVAVVLVGGCSGRPDPARDTGDGAGLDVTAQTDPETGSVVFPIDRFRPSAEEEALLVTASTLLLAECAQRAGVDWRASPVVRYSTLYDASHYFGVWTEDLAARFAFVSPMTNADLIANGYAEEGELAVHDGSSDQPDTAAWPEVGAHNGALSEADMEVVRACGDAEANQFTAVVQAAVPGQRKVTAAMTELDTLPEVQEVYRDLDACFDDVGLRPDPDAPGFPQGWALEISEEQIELALRTVACKSEVDFVRRLADQVAALQAPVVAEYADELVAARQRTDELVAKARAMVAEAQAAMPQG